MLPAQADRHDVRPDDFIIAGPAPGEPLGHELVQVVLGHVHQVGQGADNHHVGGPVVSSGARQLVHGQTKGPRVSLQIELVGVEDDHSVFPHLAYVGVVGFLVKGHQNVHVVAGAEHGIDGHTDLGPSGATLNLGRERSKGQRVVADLGGNLGQPFRRGYHSLPAFTGEPDDKVTHWHVQSSLPKVRPGKTPRSYPPKPSAGRVAQRCGKGK